MAKNEFCFQSDLSPCAIGPRAAVPSQDHWERRGEGGVQPFLWGLATEVGPPLWLPGVQAEDTLHLLLRQAHSLSCFL